MAVRVRRLQWALRDFNNPRWQARVMHGMVRLAAPRRAISFDGLIRFEVITRRLLGQPLSERAWDRMTFTDKVTYRRLFLRDHIFEVCCDKLRMRDYVA